MVARTDAAGGVGEAVQAALAAYARFFEAFNTRNPAPWAAAMRYPHVRVSPHGRPELVSTVAQYRAQATWAPFLRSGWDHTVGAPPEVLHASADKVHVRGGWTRYRADGTPILANHVTYIVTRAAEADGRGVSFGIQARFGLDAGPEGQTDAHVAAVRKLVDEFVRSYRSADAAGCAGRAHFPFFEVGVGVVDACGDAGAFQRMQAVAGAAPAVDARARPDDVRVLQSGPAAAVVAVTAGHEQWVLMCTQRNGQFGVQARSRVVSAGR